MKNQYMSYQESLDFLHKMEKRYPDLIEVIKIGMTYEGRDIVLAKISKNVEHADEKPALLYTGSIHAREWIGHELALKFIEHVAKNQDVDPVLERALTESTLYIVPCLNPDGYEYSRKHFSFWRKNRRKNYDGTYGVDLNRNFSIGFKKISNTASNVYGGEEPFSEAETRAIKDFVDTHENITIALDYHSQGNVFFPAHKFKHEAEIDGTDMNVISANMNDEFEKITGRKYGIHRGKPPVALISGSGREYYYSRGIKAIVVEVGTKNIPDYMKSMSSSIHENIPALIRTFSEVVNYSAYAPRRVDEFRVEKAEPTSVTLVWKYEKRDDIFFEIYRSTKDKDACNERTKVGISGENSFTDTDLESSTNYHYTIRAVSKKTGYKSPFAPVVKARTALAEDEFFRFLFAVKEGTGYVGQYTQEQNRAHFGLNSLFVGINKSKGICDAVVSFDLSSIPENAIIKSARFYLYPMNRVGAKIEKFGQWDLSLLEPESFSEISDFNEIEKAKAKGIIGQAIKSRQLTQGIWNFWEFSQRECQLLEEEVANKQAVFRIDGPKYLPDGEDSQMMQFDIGYGKFGGGIHYRPMLDIKYTMKNEKIKLPAQTLASISKEGVEEGILKSGFDANGDKVYGYLNFDLGQLPEHDKTMITQCALRIRNKNIFKNRSDVRFYMELVKLDEVGTYEDIKNREKIEYIGYEVAESDLNSKECQYFNFDTLSRNILDQLHQEGKTLKLVIKPTSALGARSRITEWQESVELIVKYIEKRRHPAAPVENLKISKENGMIKLSWDKVDDEAIKGYYVVRNSFHPPRHFMDGVKLYGGKDTWTYDNFASFDKEKYYAVFTYDDVPNFSEATVVRYDPLERY
ncbi:fibronectin type III domain-containing protein [Sulfurovum indicum]|uniref:carboxypeptidase T n=2 Tax=Sulfurovum TaxID=265570 RepID=A0A7M1S5T9_9BACT|nr:M14 family zinc carboxypeptidase [Sulfurovum indicum]QOR62787.1 fibronectin type III domain-containing protein [Sulfurovum indicum]